MAPEGVVVEEGSQRVMPWGFLVYRFPVTTILLVSLFLGFHVSLFPWRTSQPELSPTFSKDEPVVRNLNSLKMPPFLQTRSLLGPDPQSPPTPVLQRHCQQEPGSLPPTPWLSHLGGAFGL